MSKLGYILAALSLPFFLETAFEMYVLTVLTGPQMLGFSMMHSAGSMVLLVLAASAVSFFLLGIFSLLSVVLVAFSKPAVVRAKVFAWILAVQVLHLALFLTYDSWSPIFRRGA